MPNERAKKNNLKPAGKKAKKGKKKRKKLGVWFLLLVLILLLAGASVGAYYYTIVDTITVSGSSSYTKEEVIALSGLYTGRNIFLYDLDAAKKGIEKNPYISCLSVKRVLPKTIVIEVSERKEFAAVQTLGGGFCVIDRTGYVLDVSRQDTGSLLPVYGLSSMSFTVGMRIDDDKSKLRPYTVMELINALGVKYDEIEYIDISNTSSVKLKTKTGVTVILGDSVDIPQKIERMFKALSRVDPAKAETATIYVNSSGTTDLSYPTPVPSETPEPTVPPTQNTTLEPSETPGGEE